MTLVIVSACITLLLVLALRARRERRSRDVAPLVTVQAVLSPPAPGVRRARRWAGSRGLP